MQVITSHDVSRRWVLALMADGQVRTRNQIYTDTAKLAHISKEEMAQALTSGQSRVENSLGWAISSFTKAGIFKRIARATYQITPLGVAKAKEWRHLEGISEKQFIGLAEWDNYQAEIKARKTQQNHNVYLADTLAQSNDDADTDYEQQAITAVQELENLLAVDLLERLRTQTPEFFEKAVIRTLLAMGYGGKENLFEHVGKSHDGGIDGVIKQDPLGIQNIYIQAKRYHDGNTIGSKEIQSFVGALQGRGVERGVFITTSSFTKSAKDYAEKLLGKVVLIDGQDLVTLMIRYKVGIQTKQMLEICEIDEDFFE